MSSLENIALIDLDGTLADYDGAMREGLEKLRSPREPPLPENFYNTKDEWLENRMSLIKKQPGFWRNLKRIELGFKVLDLLSDAGYSRTILTKGPNKTTSAWSEKREWCHRETPGLPVTITEDKGSVYGRVLFDDWPPYIERWLAWRSRGLVIMLDKPYNKDFNHPNVFRVSSILDLPNLLGRLQTHYR